MDDVERNYRARIHTLEGAVRVQDEYIRQQTAALRELEAHCRASYRDATNVNTPYASGIRDAYEDVADRVAAVLGIVVSELDPPG